MIMKNTVCLKPLSPDDGQDCFQLLKNIGEKENDFTNPVHHMSYDEYKQWLIEQDNWSKGGELPEGYVPQHCYWLYVDGTPVGFGKIRLGLTPQSRIEGGNIGYAIGDSYRGHGYGTILVELLLGRAKELGVKEILITVKKCNYASKCVSEKNGAFLVKETENWWYLSVKI